MKNSKMLKIIILLLLIIFIFSTRIYATEGNIAVVNATVDGMLNDADDFLITGDRFEDTINVENLKSTSNFIYNTALTVAIILALVIGVILGVKFITSSAEGKAQIHEILIPYIAGCFVVFGSFAIWRIVVNFGQEASTEKQNITWENVEEIFANNGDLSILSDQEIKALQQYMMCNGLIALEPEIGKEIEKQYYTRFGNTRYDIGNSFGNNQSYQYEGDAMVDYWVSVRVYLDTVGNLRVLSKADLTYMANYAIYTLEQDIRYDYVWISAYDGYYASKTQIALLLHNIQEECYTRYGEVYWPGKINVITEHIQCDKIITTIDDLKTLYESDRNLARLHFASLKMFTSEPMLNNIRRSNSELAKELTIELNGFFDFHKQNSEQLTINEINEFVSCGYNDVFDLIDDERLLELEKDAIMYPRIGDAVNSEYCYRELYNKNDIGSYFINPEGYPTEGAEAVRYWESVEEYNECLGLGALSKQDLETMVSKAIETIEKAQANPDSEFWQNTGYYPEGAPQGMYEDNAPGLKGVEEVLLDLQNEYKARYNEQLEEDYTFENLECDEIPTSIDDVKELYNTYGNLHRMHYASLEAFWMAKPENGDISQEYKEIWKAIEEEHETYIDFHKEYSTKQIYPSTAYELYRLHPNKPPVYLSGENAIKICRTLLMTGARTYDDKTFLKAIETVIFDSFNREANIIEGEDFYGQTVDEITIQYENLYAYFFKSSDNLTFAFSDQDLVSMFNLLPQGSTDDYAHDENRAAVAVIIYREYQSRTTTVSFELTDYYIDLINRKLFNQSCDNIDDLKEQFEYYGHLYKLDDASIEDLYDKYEAGTIDLSDNPELEKTLKDEYNNRFVYMMDF